MTRFIRQLVGAVVLTLWVTSPAAAWHIQGLIYCDSNPNGVIDAGDTKVDGVQVKVTAQTVDVGHMYFDTSGDGVPSTNPGAGAWRVDLPDVDNTYKVELTTVGVPSGATVIVPAGGFYLPHLTSSLDHKDDADFLLNSCTPVTTTTSTTTSTTTTSTSTTTTTTTTESPTSSTTMTTTTTITATTTTLICGNGMVDAGEQCDPPGSMTCPPGSPTGAFACNATCMCPCTPATEICGNTTDDDCDGLIDCFDPDCATSLPCIHRDPSRIRFNVRPAGLDLFTSHGKVHAEQAVDLATQGVGWMLSDANGIIYRGSLQPEDLTSRANSKVRRFKDAAARLGQGQHDGIYGAKTQINSRGTISYHVKAYGNLSAATDPDMALHFYVGRGAQAQAWGVAGTWRRTRSGWVAPRAPLGSGG